MPVVRVYGIPENVDQENLKSFCLDLQKAVSRTLANVDPNQVSVFFPKDLLKSGIGEELIVFVDGVFKEPTLHHLIRRNIIEVSEAIGKVVNIWAFSNLKQCALIEVFVNECNPDKQAIYRANPL